MEVERDSASIMDEWVYGYSDEVVVTAAKTSQAWHRGLDNNKTQLLASIFTSQLLLRDNLKHHNFNGQVQWILDGL